MPGYKVKLVESPIDRYLCPKCNLILRDAVQTSEGVLCESCYADPDSAHVETGQCYPDRALRKEINQLLVECGNARCPWSGQLGHYEEHDEHCGYGPDFCENEGCGERLPPADLNRHTTEECLFRRVPCKHCGEEQAISQMEDHLRQCYKYPVECDRCSTLLRKDELEDHQENMCRCPIKTMDPECRIRKEGERSEMVGLQLVSSTKNLTSRAQESRDLQRLENQPCDNSVQLKNYPSGAHSAVCDGPSSENRMVQLEMKVDELERQNVMLKVHVSELELQLQASLASTHNGTFMWRIPDVSRRRRDAIDERITSIYSPPFYTGSNGYKMCIRASLNGDGIGCKTHLSLFFVLMKGEYDPLLKWPFEYKVSLILVDQDHRKHVVQTLKPTPSFQRPRSDMNVASSCPQFSELSVLDDDNYVKDDVMYVKCIVDTSQIFHP